MWFEDLVGGPYSARTMVHRLSCAGLSLGNVPVFRCWRWKLCPRVIFRRSRWVWGWLYRLEVCCLYRVWTYGPAVSTFWRAWCQDVSDENNNEVCRWDELRYRDTHITFHKDWFENLKVIREEYTHTHTHTQHCDLISLLLFFSKWVGKVKKIQLRRILLTELVSKYIKNKDME
jgi:hypothetical protein